MPKKLTDTLRNQYLTKATEKIKKDSDDVIKFIKEKRLSVSLSDSSSQDEAEYIYHIAREMWESDGYIEPPMGFSKISERESKFIDSIFGR